MLAATVVYVLRWSRFNDIGRPREGPAFFGAIGLLPKENGRIKRPLSYCIG